MQKSETKKHIIGDELSIRGALEKINNLPTGRALILFLINGKKQVIGSVSDGDIRRGLLKGFSLDDKVSLVMNKNFKFISNATSAQEIQRYRDEDLKIVPIINKNKQLIELIDFKKRKCILPVDAIIMAGGKGTRLHPYTKDIPKPLLELENKPIICHNIDRLLYFGVKNFYVSVNHLKDRIIEVLDKYYKNNQNISIKYIEENIPLGTLGSVALVKKYQNEDLLVINADILTNLDFEDFYLNYKSCKSDMSVAAFSVNIDVPYAVLETKADQITSFIEKPSYTYHSNAGIYLFKQKFIKIIPKHEQYDAISLIAHLIKKKMRVGHFSIIGYWLDIGNPQNYRKAKEDIRHIKF